MCNMSSTTAESQQLLKVRLLQNEANEMHLARWVHYCCSYSSTRIFNSRVHGSPTTRAGTAAQRMDRNRHRSRASICTMNTAVPDASVLRTCAAAVSLIEYYTVDPGNDLRTAHAYQVRKKNTYVLPIGCGCKKCLNINTNTKRSLHFRT